MVILGLDHVDQFHEIVRHHEAGTIPPTVMWGACPTLFDPSQAPAGRHTAFMWEKLPYRLHGDPQTGTAPAPDTARPCWSCGGSTRPTCATPCSSQFVRTPLDTERSLPNMREGDLLVGAFSNGQIGYRPAVPRAPAPTAPICPGLYLCGSSSHPGGNITGLPGLQRGAGDLGRSRRHGRLGSGAARELTEIAASSKTSNTVALSRCQMKCVPSGNAAQTA